MRNDIITDNATDSFFGGERGDSNFRNFLWTVKKISMRSFMSFFQFYFKSIIKILIRNPYPFTPIYLFIYLFIFQTEDQISKKLYDWFL